ncbi:hypothetical protein [Paracraurococcus ruber]|uniref:hypothetical protein n=1 Tax=Paracraurococcus ruber TaxID=77675 RepID=UPI0013052613|nr:hypothetical protein [Paracraurococcus ruber]
MRRGAALAGALIFALPADAVVLTWHDNLMLRLERPRPASGRDGAQRVAPGAASRRR